MKKLLLILPIGILAGILLMLFHHQEESSAVEQFETWIGYAKYDTYYDSDFGYEFQYPSFFKRDDEPTYGIGHVRFSYHNQTNITLECKVVPESVYVNRKNEFIESGVVAGMPDYQYYSHHIRKNHLWYTLTLCYHKDYKHAVSGLMAHVTNWKATSDFKLKVA